MADDIVTQLLDTLSASPVGTNPVLVRAVDEIERLRAAGDRLAADIRSGRWDDALDAWEEVRRG